MDDDPEPESKGCAIIMLKYMRERKVSVRIILNKYRRHNDGTYPIVFQIIHNRKKRLIYTGFTVREEDFDETECVVSSKSLFLSSSEVKAINVKIRKMRRILNLRINQLRKKDLFFTIDDICGEVNKKGKEISFYNYMSLQIEKKLSLSHHGIAAAYRSTQSSFSKFISSLYLSRQNVTIEMVNDHLLLEYRDYLIRERKAKNTIRFYMRNLRSMYNAAARDGYRVAKDYPFTQIQTSPCKTVKRSLPRENMIAIARIPLENRSLALARDLYLFSFYSQGMAFVDIVFLRKTNICKGTLSYYRRKTNQLIRILVTPQMQQIIDRYDSPSVFLFPILQESTPEKEYAQYRLALGRVRSHLSRISQNLELDMPLTTYTARHTWATLALNSGAAVSVISAGLGHTSEKTTRIYLNELDLNLVAKVNNRITDLSVPYSMDSSET